MTDEPTPELRALADALFAAGRAEQPEPALGRRLQLIDPRLAQRSPTLAPGPSRSPSSPVAARDERPRHTFSRPAFWLSAAALLAGGVGLWRLLPSDDPIQISAERAASEPAAVPVAAVPVTAVPVAREPQPVASIAPRVASADGSTRPAAAPVPSKPAPGRTRSAAVSVAPAPRPQLSTLRAELELLSQARSALRAGDSAQALALLDRHERERSGSGRSGNELFAEATLLRIEALSVRGEPRAASELAARFVRDNPHNALSDRAKTFIRAQPGP